MFSIKFKDVVVFGNFLSINEIDFVDVFLDKNQVKFISNSNEVYAEYRAASLCSVNQESFSCRISKSFLKSIGQEDVITIACSDGEVRISLYSGKGSLLYSCSFLQQVVAFSSYADRVLLAENIKGLPVFNLGLLEGLYQIARFNGGLVTVDGGAGAVMLKEAGAVYKEIAGIAESFTVTNKALACLKKCSNNVGSLKDMLVAVNGGFTVFVQKARMETLEDYSVLVSGRFGAKYTADINLHNLFRFLYKTKINADSVKINVKTCECVISTGHCVYTIPVDFNNAVLAAGASMEELSVPVAVLLKVLNLLKIETYSLRVMKNFIQFKSGDYIIVW